MNLPQNNYARRLLWEQSMPMSEFEAREQELLDRITALEDAAEMLWVVLANVSEGDWTKQSVDWREAAAQWRDNYFEAVKK